jgi:hypothetical protein
MILGFLDFTLTPALSHQGRGKILYNDLGFFRFHPHPCPLPSRERKNPL